MQSPNKRSMRASERRHVARIAELPCGVCASEPVEVHEIEQGAWFTAIPLCPDCHRGSFNGLHGQRRIWTARKLAELAVLGATIERLMA